MKTKIIEIDLTPKQISLLKKFLASHKIMCDNKTEFGLVAEPKIDKKVLFIRLLSVSEYEKVNRFFQKLGLYNYV